MKKFLTFAFLLLVVTNMKAQNTKEIRVYKDGDVLYNSIIISSDSIKFSKSDTARLFHYIKDGNVVKTIDISEIDSIKFVDYKECDIPEGGIFINGIKWATRNVGSLKTFVTNPEDYGGYYQWNRETTDFVPSPNYNYDDEVYFWQPSNNPCPAGWRVPTQSEFQELLKSPQSLGDRNGVDGYYFGTEPYQLFLPAAGYRDGIGTFYWQSGGGFYWSNASDLSSRAHTLNFYCCTDSVKESIYPRTFGLSVRCVAE